MGTGWQGRGPPRDGGNLRSPERKGEARGGGAGLGHQSCLSWSRDFRPTGSKAPSPSQGLSPQERKRPAAGCTQISRRPGEGHWRALGLLGVLRVPALQVAQVDGLEGCQGTECQWWVQVERQSLSLVLPSPLKALGPRPPHQAGLEAAGGWAFLPPGRPLLPREPHLLFRLGLGTFSTYSSTRPRSLPDIWLRRSRSTPCQAAGSRGGQGPYPGACHPALSVSKQTAPTPALSLPSEWPHRPPKPKLPLQQFLAPKSSLLLTEVVLNIPCSLEEPCPSHAPFGLMVP